MARIVTWPLPAGRAYPTFEAIEPVIMVDEVSDSEVSDSLDTKPEPLPSANTCRIDITISSPDAAAHGQNLWFVITPEDSKLSVEDFITKELLPQIAPVLERGGKELVTVIKEQRKAPLKAPLKVIAKAYQRSIYLAK